LEQVTLTQRHLLQCACLLGIVLCILCILWLKDFGSVLDKYFVFSIVFVSTPTLTKGKQLK